MGWADYLAFGSFIAVINATTLQFYAMYQVRMKHNLKQQDEKTINFSINLNMLSILSQITHLVTVLSRIRYQ